LIGNMLAIVCRSRRNCKGIRRLSCPFWRFLCCMVYNTLVINKLAGSNVPFDKCKDFRHSACHSGERKDVLHKAQSPGPGGAPGLQCLPRSARPPVIAPLEWSLSSGPAERPAYIA
jgi:hypothetical protein